MKKCLLIFILITTLSFAQEEHAWVYFKDKPDASLFLLSPNLMLTQRALDRRTKQGIALDEKDTPVDIDYVGLISGSNGITVKARSRWLNAVHVIGIQSNIEALTSFSMVDRIQFANKNIGNIKAPITLPKVPRAKKEEQLLKNDYGSAIVQTYMIEIDMFHDLGYEGQGMQIAIIDSGFFGVNTAGAFSHLVDNDTNNGEVLGGYDFVNGAANFYQQTGSTHGTQVLSTIAAIKEGEFRGTAPKSDVYLYVTEDPNNETPLEESYWVQAAEKADSLGVDIINTSLGYSQFDNSLYNYTYADMNGETTFITRGANVAAEKGILVLNSAGNSGNSTWKYITAPADAKNIISVGAVDASENIASFSSFGPSSDNRIKPEVSAQGHFTYVVDENNTVKTSSGTSFSSPIMAGASACVWQAFPDKTNLEIRELILDTATLRNNPNDQLGYGIPKLNSIINLLSLKDKSIAEIVSFANVTHDNIIFSFKGNTFQSIDVDIFNFGGIKILSKKVNTQDNTLDVSKLSSGIYLLHMTLNSQTRVYKIMIQ